MIIVKILGGLGNQLFQYSAARALSLKTGQKLYLDIESLLGHKERPYELNIFDVQGKILNKVDLFNFPLSILSYPLIKLKKHPNYYLEKEFTYNSEVLKIKNSIYLDGYFQSQKYFIEAEGQIRKDLQFKDKLSENEQQYFEKIVKNSAVSLHIRRGDYITNLNANNLMQNLVLDYYKNAISFIESKVKNPVFFIFSDDLDWVKSNLSINTEHYFVSGNSGKDSFRDMRLMSLCKHNIIANSSFSWWGAWLNNNPEKIVIAPQTWFKNNQLNDKDLIPEKWIKI